MSEEIAKPMTKVMIELIAAQLQSARPWPEHIVNDLLRAAREIDEKLATFDTGTMEEVIRAQQEGMKKLLEDMEARAKRDEAERLKQAEELRAMVEEMVEARIDTAPPRQTGRKTKRATR